MQQHKFKGGLPLLYYVRPTFFHPTHAVLGVPGVYYNVDINSKTDWLAVFYGINPNSSQHYPTRFCLALQIGYRDGNAGHFVQIAFSWSNSIDIGKKWYRTKDADWTTWTEF